MKWTREQLAAIKEDSKAGILLMAGAGSGKTAVLSERLISRLLPSEEGGEPSLKPENVLVLTFTKKAAKEMRQRIEKNLTERLEQSTDRDLRLKIRELRDRLPLAQISTIHAFCWELLRNNYLGLQYQGQGRISAKSRIMNEVEADEILQEAVSKVLLEIYAKLGEAALKRDFQTQSESPKEEILTPELTDYDYFFQRQSITIESTKLEADLKGDYHLLRALPDYRLELQRALEDLEKSTTISPETAIIKHAYDLFTEAARLFLDGTREFLGHPQLAVWTKKPTAEGKRSLNFEDFFCREEFAVKLGQLIEDFNRLLADEDNFAENYLKFHDNIREELEKLTEEELIPKISNRGNRDKNPDKFDLRDIEGRKILPLVQLMTGKFKAGSTWYEEFQLSAFPPLFATSAETFRKLLLSSARLARVQGKLLAKIDECYNDLKFKRDLIDYSDLEQLSLELLRQDDELAAISADISEIYVDEYQDTSLIQEEIFRLLARDGSKLFMVGDLKQSIYRFRHAQPNLFLERAAAYQEGAADGQLLTLVRNFRSTPAVLSYVNRLFARIFQREIAGLDYDETQRLLPGHDAYDLEGKVAVKILLEAEVPEAEILEKTKLNHELQALFRHGDKLRREALLTAVEVMKLKAAGYKYDEIMVLCRKNAQLASYSQVFKQLGIPLHSNRQVKIDSQELLFLSDFVEALKNPQNDIPLLAYLRSPLHGQQISEAELLEAAYFSRSQKSEKDPYYSLLGGRRYFHQRLQNYLAKAPSSPAKEALQNAMELLAKWRQELTYRPYPEVLKEILLLSPYREYLALMDRDGLGRLEDLDLFIGWLEDAKNRGLSFAESIAELKKLRETETQLADKQKISEEGKLKLLTIHAAKGLEAKVVILAAANQRLSKNNSYPLVRLSTGARSSLLTLRPEVQFELAGKSRSLTMASLGLGTELVERYIMPRYQYVLEVEALEEFAEELRILYVALTRAKERLLIVAQSSKKKLAESLEAVYLSQSANYLQVILATMAEEWNIPEDFLSGLPPYEAKLDDYLELSICDELSLIDEFIVAREQLSSSTLDSEADAISQAEVEKSLSLASFQDRELPHEELVDLPGKLSVSELTKRVARQFGGRVLELGEMEVMPDMSLLIEPLAAANTETGFSPSEYGSLLHKVLMLWDLQKSAAASDLLADLYRQLESFRSHELLDELEFAEVMRTENIDHLLAFANSELAREILEAVHVERERNFTLAVPAEFFKSEEAVQLSGEIVAVQGIIDLFYLRPDGSVVLVDYKSDRLPARVLADDERLGELLSERYGTQLYFYREAIERIYKRPVARTSLWLIRYGREVGSPVIDIVNSRHKPGNVN